MNTLLIIAHMPTQPELGGSIIYPSLEDCEVFIDGNRQTNIESIKFEANHNEPNRATLTFVGAQLQCEMPYVKGAPFDG